MVSTWTEGPIRALPGSPYSGPTIGREEKDRSMLEILCIHGTDGAADRPNLQRRSPPWPCVTNSTSSAPIAIPRLRGRAGGGRRVSGDRVVTLRAKAGPERAARAARHLHPRPLARPRLRSRRHARGRDARPALPPPLEVDPDAALVRRGKGAGRAYREAAHRAFFVEGLNLADESVARSGTGGEPGRRRSDSSSLGSPEDLGSTSYA